MNERCSMLGLNVPLSFSAMSKADKLQEIMENTSDELLHKVGHNLLEHEEGDEERRFILQDLLWEPQKEISKRCRREIALSLEIEEIFRDEGAFIELLTDLFVTYRSSDLFAHWTGVDLDKLEKHVCRNPGDWSVEDLLGFLDAFEISSRRFSKLLEGLSHGDIQNCLERQMVFVNKVNSRLKFEGFELREVGTSGGYPEFKVLPATERPAGKPKNLIFASSEKPDLRLGNALSNDIEIVTNSDKVLVYDQPIDRGGLNWQQLQDWWRDTNGMVDDAQAKKSLYFRLLKSLPKSSPPQENFFTSYFEIYKELIPSLPALLPEVWLHWDAKTVRERGVNALPRSRMDFLLLLPNDVRVVIEIDGKEHYSNGELACPKKYSEMVNADRILKLDGYQVFRFGGYELNEKNAIEMVKEFWNRLYQKYGVIPKR
jgi:very-short-patch-repair endonuclease